MARSFQIDAGLAIAGNKLTDHQRSPISVTPKRIERRIVLASGKNRNYYVATKRTFSTSWEFAPSRAAQTVDGFWGGADIADYFAANFAEFVVTLTHNNGTTESITCLLNDFNYDIVKRYAGREYWDFSIEVEEV